MHNIGALLYHPTNQTRTNAVMAAAERRKQEQNQMRTNQTPALPPLHQHHHHSMQNGLGNPLPGPAHSLAPNSGVNGRPMLDRANTFPTPPTSASSGMNNMPNSDGAFQWGGQGLGNVQGTNPLSIDTGLSNARSMPTTPATTPPGTSIQGMQQYQQSATQPYDGSRQMYAPSAQQSQYQQSNNGTQGMGRYQQGTFIKNEMGPPSRGPVDGADQDNKVSNGLMHHTQGNGTHGADEEEAEHEHDGEYTHDSGPTYDANRGSYNYTATPTVGQLQGDHSHLSPEMNGSPGHQAGSGRATPRTTAPPQSYYVQQTDYNTPPRVQPPSSNLYSVMSSERGTANGSSGGDVYAAHNELVSTMSNGYSSQQPIMNGSVNGSVGSKRSREDDEESRPLSQDTNGDMDGLKRRKTVREGSVPGIGGASYNNGLNRSRSVITQRRQ